MVDFQFRTEPATVESIVAQGISDSIGCRYVVDDVVKAQTVPHEVDAFIVCPLKAA